MEQHEAETPADDPVLRSAFRSLQPMLFELGLVPSRFIPFIPSPTDHPDVSHQHANEYLRKPVKKVLQLELQENGVELAVEDFADHLLNEEAPSGVLVSFMRTLHLTNNDPIRRPNPGAWRVLDVLQLARVYMPVQQALVTFFSERPGDLPAVLTQLTEQQLLRPESFARMLSTLSQDDTRSAVERMLAYVYDVARIHTESRLNVNRREGCPPVWLDKLLCCAERCGLVRDSICPASVLSAANWQTVCDKLVSGMEHRTRQNTDETQSEAGDSDISDTTINNYDNNNADDNGRKNNCADQKFTERNLLGIDEACRGTVEETRQQRTAHFVASTCTGSRENVPVSVEIIDHNQPTVETTQLYRQSRAVGPAAVWVERQDADRDDSISVITEVSAASTEENSHVTERGQMDTSIRDLARTLAYSGLSDVPDNGPGQIKLMGFQKELLRWAEEGKNVAIFLPTGTGKTFIVLKYVQEHLSRPDPPKPVVFLAPKVKLAEQQYRRFRFFFPHTTYLRTGRSRSCDGPLAELLNTYQVFVMTPMCLVEATKRGEVKISDFSVMVLDECHHTRGNQDFKRLMDVYMDIKFTASTPTNQPRLPQVIGLTASPGVGPGNTQEKAVAHLKELCFSMDVDKICTVKENLAELKRFVNKPKHEIHQCRRRTKNNFRTIIEGMMKTIEDAMLHSSFVEEERDKEHQEYLRKILTAPDLHRGQLRYTQWASSLDNKLGFITEDDVDVHRQLYSSAHMLLMYQKCLMLNEDCESRNALDNLLEMVREVTEQQPSHHVDRELLNHFKEHLPELERACRDTEDYNPKLRMLENILLTMMDKNQDDCACMVFVRTIDLSLAIQRWIQEHADLKTLRPGRITGNRRKGGMSQPEISDVLDKFRKGDYKLVVCTSAAEEGLDFQACNVVIRYDYVTSMISMIQTRGRARRMDSQYCVLSTHSQGSMDKEKGNLASEQLMKKATEEVEEQMEANANTFLYDMNEWQRSDWKVRKESAERAKLKRHMLDTSAPTFQLLCRRCKIKACLSSDLRLFNESNRLVIADDFRNKWKRVELKGKAPERYQFNLEKIAKVHCKECPQDWGCLVRHRPSDREFPLLKLQSFYLIDNDTNKMRSEKFKWERAPFSVKAVTDQELTEHTECTTRLSQ